MEKTVYESFLDIIRKYFCDFVDCRAMNINDIKVVETSISSIKYVSLIVELEMLFNIKIEDPLIYSMELTIGELYEYVNQLVTSGDTNDRSSEDY